ncbi:MAG: NAD(P)-dependent glycerol-3-phosphate dehydrogenase [Thermodesulfobacteria bacterium]|nr:NAD(P)-dependent glycerol-3-phosphate dehydrogenase [Thermodesulfobacteriota bacterium]
MKIAVIGAGSWGTALANLLAKKGERVHLLARRPEVVEAINRRHENPFYLPKIELSPKLEATLEAPEALEGAEIVVLAVPSHALRETVRSLRPHLGPPKPLVSTIKGLEEETLLTMSQLLEEELPGFPVVVLSGPSFAEEVAQERPTAVTVAGYRREIAESVQHLFSTGYFRAYLSLDVLGVELAGALKNVIAIAVGISDGLGLGLNARAALITRGLAEISRLGVRLGANPLTFSGLAGLGDLVLTCTGALSRNRTVGLRLGRGEKLKDILRDIRQVAEGVRTTVSARELARRHGVEMPITEAVYRVLYHEESPLEMAQSLLSRKLKEEFA